MVINPGGGLIPNFAIKFMARILLYDIWKEDEIVHVSAGVFIKFSGIKIFPCKTYFPSFPGDKSLEIERADLSGSSPLPLFLINDLNKQHGVNKITRGHRGM